MTDGSGKGIFPPGTARHGPPSDKRRAACKRLLRMAKIVWTEDRDAELMEHISRERSFTQTAKLMGLNVDQVSGRFKRLRDQMGWQAS